LLYSGAVQSDFLAPWQRSLGLKPATILIGTDQVPVEFVRNERARRYVLRVKREGVVRVTIPRGGSIAFALEFAYHNEDWLGRQLQLRRTEAQRSRAWDAGTEILFRGEQVCLKTRLDGEVKLVEFADQAVILPLGTTDLRAAIEHHLWSLAEKELLPRTFQLAALHQITVRRVTVRNQRSRWGSCSPRGTISLNWRLIQAPAGVRDYLIVHELMHRREMNHSARYWRLVQAACPDFAQAERWLNAHAHLLR
jgi:predicted metal-dependent hydrolase